MGFMEAVFGLSLLAQIYRVLYASVNFAMYGSGQQQFSMVKYYSFMDYMPEDISQ